MTDEKAPPAARPAASAPAASSAPLRDALAAPAATTVQVLSHRRQSEKSASCPKLRRPRVAARKADRCRPVASHASSQRGGRRARSQGATRAFRGRADDRSGAQPDAGGRERPRASCPCAWPTTMTPRKRRRLRGKPKIGRTNFHQDPVVAWLVVVGGPGLGAFARFTKATTPSAAPEPARAARFRRRDHFLGRAGLHPV